VLVLAAQIQAQIYGYGLGKVNGRYYGNYGAYPFAGVRATTAYTQSVIFSHVYSRDYSE
jgi:hypothetical protein